MSDQADKLRQMVRQAADDRLDDRASAPTVVVSGGKGGVGATTAALHLSMAVADIGLRTVFVDADLSHADATLITQLDRTPHGHLMDVLLGQRTAREVLVQGPGKVRILPGAWTHAVPLRLPPTAPDRFWGELRQLSRNTDVIVIDAGTGVSPWAEACWRAASIVLAVTTPDDVAVMDTYAMLKLACAGARLPPLQLVVNQCDSLRMADEVHSRLGRAVYRFLGELLSESDWLPSIAALQSPCGALPGVDECGARYAEGVRRLASVVVDRLELDDPDAAEQDTRPISTDQLNDPSASAWRVEANAHIPDVAAS